MDQRPTSMDRTADQDMEESELPATTEMGFYETVASRQASVSTRRAFRVTVTDDEPPPQELLEKQDSIHEATPLATPLTKARASYLSTKLPPITNTAIVANSSPD